MNDDQEYLAAGLAAGGLSEADLRTAEELYARKPEFRALADEYRDALVGATYSDAPIAPSESISNAILSIPGTVEQPADPNNADAPRGNVISMRDRRPSKLRRSVIVMSSIAAALAIIFLAATSIRLGSQADTAQSQSAIAQSQAAAADQLLSAPDLRRTEVSLSSGGAVSVVYSMDRKLMSVTSKGVQAVEPGKTLQLWVIADGKPFDAGLLNNRTSVFASPAMSKGAIFGVTVEPAGGSTAPTTQPIGTAVLNG